MAIALGVFILLVFTVVMHTLSPWWFTPLASNWGTMDDTIVLTFWITGLTFIVFSVFMIYCLIKYRHREGSKAEFQPENKKLEIWLTVFTTVGVIALLAPGLKVWGDYIDVPDDAHVVEAVAQQWQWSYRYPGADGKLGSAHVKHVTFDNPTGVNPDDPNGADDIVLVGREMHLPKDKPVKLLLRSKDVLHNFYVPNFRAKMDIVPGLVSYQWFTPTVNGRYEVVCAEYCGMGHYNMRSHVVVEDETDYNFWLESQPTFASSRQDKVKEDPLVARGREVAQNNGCLGCHSLDGGTMLGPTWKGMYGKMEKLADGSTVLVDDEYFIESVINPNAKIVEGFAPVMPPADLSEEDLQALLVFARSGGLDSGATKSKQPVEDMGGEPSAMAKKEGSGDIASLGRKLYQQKGCIACHSVDGAKSLGPTWKGLYGSQRELADGSSLIVDDVYLTESILEPNAKIVKGFSPVMPPAPLSDEEVAALVDYIRNGIK